jgi:hypothetical protein
LMARAQPAVPTCGTIMGRYRLEIEIPDFDGRMLCEHGAGSPEIT